MRVLIFFHKKKIPYQSFKVLDGLDREEKLWLLNVVFCHQQPSHPRITSRLKRLLWRLFKIQTARKPWAWQISTMNMSWITEECSFLWTIYKRMCTAYLARLPLNFQELDLRWFWGEDFPAPKTKPPFSALKIHKNAPTATRSQVDSAKLRLWVETCTTRWTLGTFFRMESTSEYVCKQNVDIKSFHKWSS